MLSQTMSNASRQSLLLLSVVSGTLKEMLTHGYAEQYDVLPTVDWAFPESIKILEQFPSTGNEKKNLDWMLTRLEIWGTWLDSEVKPDLRMIVLVSIGLHIVTDLLAVIKNKNSIDLISPLNEVFVNLSDKIDPKGINFEAYESADYLINKLYSLIGF